MWRTKLVLGFIVWGFCLQLNCLAEQRVDYDLGIGDRLKIMLPSTYKHNLNQDNVTLFSDYNITTYIVVVDNEGNITLPIIGTVEAAGITISGLQTNVEQAIKKDIKKTIPVNVILEYSERQYGYISGNVKNPGKYHFSAAFSLFDLLAAAGGVSDYGVIEIVILRNGKDLYETNQKNMMLQFGDSVFVKPLEKNIYLAGEFKKPGTYSIDYESIPLQQAIGLGGGLAVGADSYLKLIHKNGESKMVDVNKEIKSTSNIILVKRGDTLIANTTWLYIKDGG
ncbi:MAG TPA: hypothetical protein DCS13_09540, partial [Candidatus Margulisbacteria bacterium]|nr:hypothetical protein [Candidatus Margulisiibacteriota bacterium]